MDICGVSSAVSPTPSSNEFLKDTHSLFKVHIHLSLGQSHLSEPRYELILARDSQPWRSPERGTSLPPGSQEARGRAVAME